MRHSHGEGADSGVLLRIKESATELKTFLHEWSKLHTSGILILNSIKTLKFDSQNGSDQNYPPGLQDRCDQLQHIVEKMEKCLANFALLVQQLSALVQLDALQGGMNRTIFLSWSSEKFRRAYQDIFDAYTKEWSLKNAIKEEVAHCSRKDNLMFHIMSWTSQPFIGNSCLLLCENIFLECGLR